MMFKKKLLASAMATALVAGVMVSGSAHAVRVSETGAGGVLLGPLYLAGQNGYSTTTVKVVNPSLTDAVKAKVVLRSRKNSEECRDFLLYLTPGDVAYFDISSNVRNASGAVTGTAPTGYAQVWSDDDSLLSSRTTASPFATFGSQAGSAFNTMTTSTADVTTDATRLTEAADTCQVGHIEVIGAYAVRGVVTTSSGAVTIERGMSKFNLLRVFDTPRPSLVGDVTNSAGATANYSSRVQLFGSVEIKSGVDTLSYQLTGLRDGVNANTAALSTAVIQNAAYDVTVGAQSPIGLAFGAAGSDTIGDIEGALATTGLNGLYQNSDGVQTNMLVTFPTRYRHRVNAQPTGNPATYNSPFFTLGQVAYGVQSLDNQENIRGTTPGTVCIVSPCPATVVTGTFMTEEVNYIIAPTFDFLSGWYATTLTQNGANVYDNINGATGAIVGLPAIGYTHRYVAGSSITRSLMERMTRTYMVP